MQLTNKNILPIDFYLNDDLLRARHEKSRCINQANLFFPSSADVVEYDSKKKKTLRKIFESKLVDYLEHEKQYMKELCEEISRYNVSNPKNKLNIPADFSDCEVLRLHQATKYNSSKTIKLIKERIEWREAHIPPKLTNKVLEILNCGFVYVHGRDCKFRPIIVMNIQNYKKNEDLYTFEEWLQAAIYFMEYIVNNLLIPGQVENWNVISDFEGVNLFFLPSNIKKLMGVLQSNWRCRLNATFLLNMSSLVRGLWKIAKAFLDEATVQKVQFIDSSNKSNILTYINEHQIEEKFGGKSPNIVPGMNQLFPPIFPSDNFLKPDQNESQGTFVSEEKYKEMYKSSKLAQCGDYFLKKWEKEEEEKKVEIALAKKSEDEVTKSKNIDNKNSTKSPGEDSQRISQTDDLFVLNKLDLKLENEKTKHSAKKFNALKGNVLHNTTPKVMRFFNNRLNNLTSQSPAIEGTPDIITSYARPKNSIKFRSKSQKLRIKISKESEMIVEDGSDTNTPNSEKIDDEIDNKHITTQDNKNENKKDCIIY